AIGAAVIVGFLGNYFIRLWVGDGLSLDANVVMSLAAYFVIWMWNHSNTAVLFGLGKLWGVAITLFVEGTLVLIIGYGLVPVLGNFGMALSLCVAGVVTSSWILPLMIRRELQAARIEDRNIRIRVTI
ncbi:MAG: hypothetical protein KGL39_57375, partial [Patescibacteria group bacterium]|nr:hypothetical protein [Patescibacteria group bacterium]